MSDRPDLATADIRIKRLLHQEAAAAPGISIRFIKQWTIKRGPRAVYLSHGCSLVSDVPADYAEIAERVSGGVQVSA